MLIVLQLNIFFSFRLVLDFSDSHVIMMLSSTVYVRYTRVNMRSMK